MNFPCPPLFADINRHKNEKAQVAVRDKNFKI